MSSNYQKPFSNFPLWLKEGTISLSFLISPIISCLLCFPFLLQGGKFFFAFILVCEGFYKSCRLGGWNNGNFFSSVMDTGILKSRCQWDSIILHLVPSNGCEERICSGPLSSTSPQVLFFLCLVTSFKKIDASQSPNFSQHQTYWMSYSDGLVVLSLPLWKRYLQ